MPESPRMHRMQFYIAPDQYVALSALAARRRVPMAELIREAIEAVISSETSGHQDAPELAFIGTIDWPDTTRPASTNPDAYIYRKDWER